MRNLLLLGLLLFTPLHGQASLFGSDETFSENLQPFSKWNKMLKRHNTHLDRMISACKGKPDCRYERWKSFYEGLKDKPMAERLNAVNRNMNEQRYVLDIVNWKMEDYWATPYEFFIKNGDCEDYAIAKYITLRRMGMPASKMRIVVLQDKNLKVIHSVLAVYDGGSIYILDNQISRVVKDGSIGHYMPIYSINEEGWWRHKS